jgi:hypothetical protein
MSIEPLRQQQFTVIVDCKVNHKYKRNVAVSAFPGDVFTRNLLLRNGVRNKCQRSCRTFCAEWPTTHWAVMSHLCE